jgi:hypothetical protein
VFIIIFCFWRRAGQPIPAEEHTKHRQVVSPPSIPNLRFLEAGLITGGLAMWRNVLIALALSSCVLLAACGGSTNPMSAGSGNSVPMSLTIGDTPPNGVAVLFFEATITGATLQPSLSGKPVVTVMTTPMEVEFGHLQTDTAWERERPTPIAALP